MSVRVSWCRHCRHRRVWRWSGPGAAPCCPLSTEPCRAPGRVRYWLLAVAGEGGGCLQLWLLRWEDVKAADWGGGGKGFATSPLLWVYRSLGVVCVLWCRVEGRRRGGPCRLAGAWNGTARGAQAFCCMRPAKAGLELKELLFAIICCSRRLASSAVQLVDRMWRSLRSMAAGRLLARVQPSSARRPPASPAVHATPSRCTHGAARRALRCGARHVVSLFSLRVGWEWEFQRKAVGDAARTRVRR